MFQVYVGRTGRTSDHMITSLSEICHSLYYHSHRVMCEEYVRLCFAMGAKDDAPSLD